MTPAFVIRDVFVEIEFSYHMPDISPLLRTLELF